MQKPGPHFPKRADCVHQIYHEHCTMFDNTTPSQIWRVFLRDIAYTHQYTQNYAGKKQTLMGMLKLSPPSDLEMNNRKKV